MAREDMTYAEALHAMQSGVAFEQARESPNYDHAKHLRVGLNARAVDQAGLATLLIEKGLLPGRNT